MFDLTDIHELASARALLFLSGALYKCDNIRYSDILVSFFLIIELNISYIAVYDFIFSKWYILMTLSK